MKIANTREELYELFLPKNKIGAELGVCRGANAISLYNIAQPESLYLVDIWEFDPLTYKHHPEELWYNDWEKDVRELFVDHESVKIKRQKSCDFLKNLFDNGIFLDWVYIDADHKSAGIDLELSLRVMKKGSIIMMHDFLVHPVAWDTNTVAPVLESIASLYVRPLGLSNEKFPTIVLEVL